MEPERINKNMERNTRDSVEPEYHYAVFDDLADGYNAGKISLDGLKKLYEFRTGIEVRELHHV